MLNCDFEPHGAVVKSLLKPHIDQGMPHGAFGNVLLVGFSALFLASFLSVSVDAFGSEAVRVEDDLIFFYVARPRKISYGIPNCPLSSVRLRLSLRSSAEPQVVDSRP